MEGKEQARFVNALEKGSEEERGAEKGRESQAYIPFSASPRERRRCGGSFGPAGWLSGRTAENKEKVHGEVEMEERQAKQIGRIR